MPPGKAPGWKGGGGGGGGNGWAGNCPGNCGICGCIGNGGALDEDCCDWENPCAMLCGSVGYWLLLGAPC
jgi:hypothetical protein